MYLKNIAIENVGPIANLSVELPFRNGLPLPLVLVGPNGSGKSTLLSFVVNALVGFKQQAFEKAEVEQNRVYRLRGTHFIRQGANWSHANLSFEENLSLDEWVLDRPRKAFESEVNPLPSNSTWKQIPEDEFNRFLLTPQPPQHIGGRTLSKSIQKLFKENVVLFFPSDRFELPNWLNEGSLADELRFPEPTTIEGQTARRIFSRALLQPTLAWIKGVTLDALLNDAVATPFTIPDQNGVAVPYFTRMRGRDSIILEFVGKILARILDADSESVQWVFFRRNMGSIAARFERGGRLEYIPNMLGLSAGQAALFCIFSNVIRDFDLAGPNFQDLSDVRGIVLLDEADLHLHVDLQYRVLPELMKLFPKVQFIVTAHSPLFVMGMEKVFGDEGFRVIDMPSGTPIETESFSEFRHALGAFTRTRAFDQQLIEHIQRAANPVVLVEGKLDVTHLQTAWEKLNPGQSMPWDIVPSGGFSTKESRGSADMLRTMLRACCLHIERAAVGLFDHDEEGVEQFLGLKADGFTQATEKTHWKHPMQPVHALLMPVPLGREKFVSAKAKSCFFAVEHYYSDTLLARFGLKDDPIVADSAVFGIVSDSKKKSRFAENLASLDAGEFANFRCLFDRLLSILGCNVEGTSGTQAIPTIVESPGTSTGDQASEAKVKVLDHPPNAQPEHP